MPKKGRIHSDSGVYHVMLRGINRAPVFVKSVDIKMFLEIMGELKQKFDFKIYAYVFMTNHVHMLIKESEKGKIGKFMQCLLVRYVYWYNGVHTRCGSLFQTRFKSKPVDSVAYFQRVLRYIHRNPVKAKKCRHVWQYADSSYNSYFAEDPGIIDRDEVFNEYIPRDEFKIYNDSEDIEFKKGDFLYMTDELPIRHTEENAGKIMKKVTGLDDMTEFGSMNIDFIFSKVRELRRRGLSYGQIGRAIHKNKSAVFRWDKKAQQAEANNTKVA